ncbi:hypothetical protein [Streptacidiphilus carbonis]|jgi:hypothetical protein|uniref:hypothetical protein n=1 Tax=Streptacidiphilus carbonis TaxID=105422 RepID=UPI0005AA8B52|nr:hypothetical protein [Streptacidiphilus carbonis]
MRIYEMRAEYVTGPAGRRIGQWHMIKDNGITALCGYDTDPAAEKMSDLAWGHTEEKFCHTCGAIYLREVP